jgi:hypothetical protein
MIQFEHYALNLNKPHEIAAWYVQNLGCRIVTKMETAPFTVFLADQNDRVFWEIYRNPQAPFSGVCNCDPLEYHLAFAVDDPGAWKAKILDAGGSYVTTVETDGGSVLIMMRDPWGIALQICKRLPPMLR